MKAIVADQTLEVQALKEIAKGTGRPSPPAPGGRDVARPSRRLRASRDPAGDAWTTVPSPGQDIFGHLSCPSVAFCVTDDASGILASTDPTGGTNTWRRAASLDAPSTVSAFESTSLACPSTTLCVVGNSNGYLWISTNPTGGAKAWNLTFAGPSGPGRLSLGGARVSGTVAIVVVGCNGYGSARCRASATMTALRSPKKRVTVGSAGMTVVAHARARSLRVPLNRTGRRLLTKRHKLRVYVVIDKVRYPLTFTAHTSRHR